MKPRHITIGILVLVTLLLIAWDIYVATNSIDGDTISEIVLGFAQRHPVVAFMLGVVMGHLFWPQDSTR